MSRVDVIVPCYNYALYLPECIQSILSQEVDLRVLILDDASSDDTPNVAAEWAVRDSRVQWRRHSVNQGHIATYNEGLEWSSGSYTLLISADDMLTPGALARAVAFMEAHPEVGFVYGRAIKLMIGQPTPRYTDGLSCTGHVEAGQRWLERLCHEGTNLIYSPEVMTRTSLQHTLGGYRAALPHTADLEMWMRFAAHADVGILEADQAYYRIHGDNMHIQQFGATLDDLQQRYAAFQVGFAECHTHIAQCDALRDSTFRTLATEALWSACQALEQLDQTDERSWREAARTAVEIYPSIRFHRAYWGYRARAFRGTALFFALRRFITRKRRTSSPLERG